MLRCGPRRETAVLLESLSSFVLTQIPKFGIVLVLVVVLVLGALAFVDRKETDVLQLICSVSLIAKRSGFSRTTTSTRTTPQIRNLCFKSFPTRNELAG